MYLKNFNLKSEIRSTKMIGSPTKYQAKKMIKSSLKESNNHCVFYIIRGTHQQLSFRVIDSIFLEARLYLLKLSL